MMNLDREMARIHKILHEIRTMSRLMAADLNEMTLDRRADECNDLSFDELPKEVQDKMMMDFMECNWDGANAPDETRFKKIEYDESRNVVVPNDIPGDKIDMRIDMSKPGPNDGEIAIYPISYVQELEMKVSSYENILDAQDKQSDEQSKGENDGK